MPTAGLTSPRSVTVRNARRLANRRERVGQRRFLAEGPQAVREALGRPDTVLEVFAVAGLSDRHPELRRAGDVGGVRWHQASDAVLAALSETTTTQGVVAVCRFVDLPLDEVLATAPNLVVVCADPRDPGNAGAVIRCADAAGADAVVLAGSFVDPYNGKCVRASAGSLFHVPLVTLDAVVPAIDRLHDAGLQVLAADGSGPVDLDAVIDDGRLSGPTAWLFGNEAWGLSDEARALADATVRIPIHGRAESLNLATAAAVCLYASARAQRGDGATRTGTTQ